MSVSRKSFYENFPCARKRSVLTQIAARRIVQIWPSESWDLHPVSDDTTMLLADNLRIHPDVLIGNGNGIFGSGVQGSGKTGIMVRILEQASRFHVPMIVFDREGDILPAVERFPRGVIGTHDNCPSARDIVKNGLQVVYDLSTWEAVSYDGLRPWGVQHGRPPRSKWNFLCSKVCQFELLNSVKHVTRESPR